MKEGPDRTWQLFDGPFQQDFFTSLGDEGWQLLVNGVDREVPAVADLLVEFDMVPRWRVDDVMVSYAPAGASIGAHSDSFDVFLLQGSGEKRWSVSLERRYQPDDIEQHVKDLDVRILSDFQADATWTLQTGDMLYVPPHCGHEGVAVTPGQTISLGFLAPQHGELLAGYALDVAGRVPDTLRYRDTNLQVPQHVGEISLEAIADVKRILDDMPRDSDSIASWFGRFISLPRGGPAPEAPELELSMDQLRDQLADDALCRHETTRMLFARMQDGSTTLFVDGLEYRSGETTGTELLSAIELIADEAVLHSAALERLGKDGWELVVDLFNDGYLYLRSDRLDGDNSELEEGELSDPDPGCMD